jgi:hypothetical protein
MAGTAATAPNSESKLGKDSSIKVDIREVRLKLGDRVSIKFLSNFCLDKSTNSICLAESTA